MKDRKSDFLELGYKSAIVLAFLGIIASAVYLFLFLSMSPDPADIRTEMLLLSVTAERRMLLLSTAVFVGMSFGFLGFALFLIHAKGDTDVDVSTKDYRLKIARLSPGLFVILCATVIIIVCATFRIEYQLEVPNTQHTNGQAGKTEPSVPIGDLGIGDR